MLRRTLAVFAFCSIASAATFACKGDPDRPPATGDTGEAPTTGPGGGGGNNGEGGAGDSGGGKLDAGDGAAAACNTLVDDGNVVDQNRVVTDPPTGTGGTIADGTYELTSADVYVSAGGTPGPSGVTFRGVLRLTSGKLERVTEMTPNQGATPVESRTFGDLTAGGTTFTVLQSCPVALQDQYTYSVQGNTLNITSLSTRESFTFTLR